MNSIYLMLLLLFSVSGLAQKFKTEEIVVNQWIDGTIYKTNPSSSDLVIIVPGSGPTDRNGNQPQMINNSLKFLAEGLAEKEINAFTYDKKFLKQMKQADFDESQLIFDDLVEDVVEIVRFFDDLSSYKNIYLLGHSEGALVGLLAAQQLQIAGFVSIAGVAEPIDVILKQQIGKQAPFLLEETEGILAELKIGKQVENVSPMLQTIFRESVQPYLISWMKYNPLIEIQQLNCPILLLQGTKDLQVSVENAEKLHQSYPNSDLVIIDQMNHILKPISGGEAEIFTSYNQADLPISETLVHSIVKFIQNEG